VSGLSIQDGAEVECGGRRFIITQLIGFDFVVARDIETDDLVRLAVVDLNPISPAPSPVPSLPDLSKVDDRGWAEARRRLDLIAPLLEGMRAPRAVIVERARAAGLDASTLYRWARAYRASGLLSSLLPYGGALKIRKLLYAKGRYVPLTCVIAAIALRKSPRMGACGITPAAEIDDGLVSDIAPRATTPGRRQARRQTRFRPRPPLD
jgi:hypothetical protein